MTSDQEALEARFREIADERLRTLNEALLRLEQGDADEGLVDKVMREIHTFKGEARMLGLGAVNRIAHRTEDLLLAARRSEAFQDADHLQHVYAGFDLLAALLAEGAGAGVEDPRVKAFEAQVDARLLIETPEAPLQKGPPPLPAKRETPSTGGAPEAVAAPPTAAGAEAGGKVLLSSDDAGGSQRVTRRTIDEITRTAGEIGVLQAHVRQCADDATEIHLRLRGALMASGAALVGAESCGEILTEMEGVLRAMRDLGFDASIRQHRLQAAVERMRLAAVSTLFGRYPRTVRDLARELGKEARLVVVGGHVGADQQILDLLADPLVHLLRNAVDHGLEPPETRLAGGKPRRGTIRLEARQAGRFVEILVADDGRGLDTRAIADAAVRKGLLSEADVLKMSDTELTAQLFRPAFSTRRTATDISGRGVGLDVVKSAIEDLGGNIHIESDVGRGTTFVLRLPVSIALVDALVLDLGCALYAIPSAYVEHILEVEASQLESAGGRDVVRLEDGLRTPVLDLATALGFPTVPRAPGDDVRLVVVAEGARRIALRVPGFEGELALVQEGLDPFLKGLKIVTGTAMLDGGRRVVMLNGVQLLELTHEPTPGPGAECWDADDAAPAPKVLVIEDSDLTRAMLVSTLTGAGMQVSEAVNGRVGLDLFAATSPDLVLTDLEMPLVGGLEVIRTIRQGARNPTVPIVVLTTVDDEVTKAEAAEAGADVYLNKASLAGTNCLETLNRLLAGRREVAP